MRAVLEHCAGRQETYLPASAVLIREGETTGDLYILVEGELEVLKGDTVVAVITEPGSILGEMSVLLNQPHTATVRVSTGSTVYQIDDGAGFMREKPAVALLVATLLAQRLNAATTYLADIKAAVCGARQSSGDGRRRARKPGQPVRDASVSGIGSAAGAGA